MGVFLLDDLRMYYSFDIVANPIQDIHDYLGTGIHDLDAVGTGVNGESTGNKLLGASRGTLNASNYVRTSGDHPDYTPPSTGMTLAGWALIPVGTLTSNHPLFAHYRDTGSQESWLLYGRNSDDVFAIYGSNNGSSGVQAGWTSSYLVDTWYHVAAFLDAENDRIGISVDRGTTVWANLTFPLFNSNQPLDCHFFSASTDISGGARMDEWGIWHRILNSDELDALYNSGGTPPSYSTFVSASGNGNTNNIQLLRTRKRKRRGSA